jgi:hypothetical protein
LEFGLGSRKKEKKKRKRKKVELPCIVDVFVIFLSMDAFLFE